MGTHWSRNNRESFKSDGSKYDKNLKKQRSFLRARLKKSLASGISCVSVKSDNLQGCAANVKETPPSPKDKWVNSSSSEEKHAVAHDEDLVESSDSLRPNFSSSEEEHTVAHDEDLVESSDNVLAKESMRSLCSVVPPKTDDLKDGVISVNDSSLTRRPNFSSSEEEHTVAHDEDLVESADNLLAKESMRSLCSVGHLETDDSKDGVISVNDSSLTRRPNFSSSEEEHTVAHDEDLVESADNLSQDISTSELEDTNNDEVAVKSSGDELISVESGELSDSSLSCKNDQSKSGLIDFKDRSSPREETVLECPGGGRHH